MKIKELRVVYSAPIFNVGGGLALPLAIDILRRLFEVVKGVKSQSNLKAKKNPPLGRDERRERK